MAEFKAEQGWQAPKLAMVGLVAVQIGLVDMLREEHGITPAGMLGHSAGMSFTVYDAHNMHCTVSCFLPRGKETPSA